MATAFKASTLVSASALVLAACASVPRDEGAPTVHVPTLERMCFDRDGVGALGLAAGRGLTHVCYLAPAGDDAGDAGDAAEAVGGGAFSRPEETVWSRVTDGGVVAGGRVHVAHGQMKQSAAGQVRWVLDPDGRIAQASLGGQFGLSWRWDDEQVGLAQLDLVWPDRQVTVTGRGGNALRVQVGFGGARFWESTVLARGDGSARAHEAWLGEGRLEVPFPDARGELAVFPVCPLGDREVWDDWNGRFPRVMRCLRGDAEWLRIERDGRGRIAAIAEKRVRGLGGEVGGAGEEEGGGRRAFERTLRITWHEHGLTPERVWVEVDARKDGLEAHFSPRGVPEVTRLHKRGQLDGLAVMWSRARARAVRMYAEGRAAELELVTRWTEGLGGERPTLEAGLEANEPPRSAGETGALWPE